MRVSLVGCDEGVNIEVLRDTGAKQSKKVCDADVTLADVKSSVEPVVWSSLPVTLSRDEWVTAQRADHSLSAVWDQVLTYDPIEDVAQGYFVQNNLLVRKWSPCDHGGLGEPVFQLVVPYAFRNDVMKSAHDHSGHFGVRKTYLHLLKHFFWPRVKKDVAAYIKSCHVCQLTGKPNQKVKPAPLQPVPAVDEPFEYLSSGFSPNELVFGHAVRSLLAALKSNLVSTEAPRNLIDFVTGFHHRLCMAGCMAKARLQLAQDKVKRRYDRRTGDDGVLRPVCFFSRKFNRYQSHFEVYVGGMVPLVVYTDHNPLTFLRSLKSPNPRLVRWSLFLQGYDLDIRHIKGPDNILADALSRAPLSSPG
ncbi:uncharacterized protein LOC121629272 [Melanotaenia boesemani]|uniref:uncharacterized protein LOC121629272 n=1 Tax=Melanotaenia boesemani TaxID=1250792 RepID=UPI001C03D97B|nr:uncharacterized protein LOC121629272 [Melanotaenia boesemani]